MTAKKYLSQLESLDIKICQRKKQLEDLQADLTSISAVRYDKVIVKSSAPGNANYTELVERIDEMKEQITEQIYRFYLAKDKIIEQIQALDNVNHISILYARYVEYKSLVEIAAEMRYTYEYTRELHGVALKNFSEKYESSYTILQ